MAQHDPSERQTRKKVIDPKLAAAGWKVVPFTEGKPLSAYSNHAIEEYPTAKGPADYALVANGQLLGIVEAKKTALAPQEVIGQAKRYSSGVEESAVTELEGAVEELNAVLALLENGDANGGKKQSR